MVVLIRKGCSKSNVTNRLESEDPQSDNTMGWVHGAATPWGRFTVLQHQQVGFTELQYHGGESMVLQHHGVDSWSYNIRGATTPRGGILTKASES